MGDVKVASVAHAVAPMAAAAASASPVSTVAVGTAAPVAASELAEEREREEREPVAEVKSEAAVTTEKKTVAAAETAIISEAPVYQQAEGDMVEAAHAAARVAESHANCNGRVHETMESETSLSEEKETVTEGDVAESNVAQERVVAEENALEDVAANGAAEGESDGVAVAPVSPAAMNRKRPRSPPTRCETEPNGRAEEAKRDSHEDEEQSAITSVEEQSPEVICLDGDTQEEDDDDEDGADTVGSELSAVDENTEAPNAQQTPSRRRRKRAKVLGFSNNRRSKDTRQRRLSVNANTDEAVVVAPHSRARRQRSGESLADAAAAADATGAAAAAAPSSSEVVTWDWNSCSVYFDPLTQTSMDELSAVRRENAQLVAANDHLWEKMRRFDNDATYLAGMIADVGVDEDVSQLRFRAVNRGRAFRDVWEEEDFLLRQRKPAAIGRGASKKRPFAGCEGVSSYRKLVRGFDDDLFDKYLQHLEANAKRKAALEHDETNGRVSPERIETSPVRRLKTTKRPAKDLDTLPPLPSGALHPAACGSWKLKGKEPPSFDSIHPACIRSAFVPQRWLEEMARTAKPEEAEAEAIERPRRSGRRDAGKQENEGGDTDEGDEAKAETVADDHTADELVELPSFGVVVDEDELSREIDNSILRLLELSALNWRRAQAVYERAVAHIEVTPLLLGEEAIKLRLEKLYRKIFPAVAGDQDDADEAPPRELQLMSKPKDIVAYAVKPCSDSHEAMAVGASVEFAIRLKKGDAIDVLDRNGCWNDGVVINVLEEAGVGLKYVLVSYALWGDDSSEWVSIADGRVLPRGVADGRVTFKTAPSSMRKKRVELNKELADLLQRTYPLRRAARAHLGVEKEEVAQQSSKKQRRQR